MRKKTVKLKRREGIHDALVELSSAQKRKGVIFTDVLFGNILQTTWQQVVMWCIGGLLIYLAIAKEMEPSLLLPMGFGAILVNLPFSGAITQGAEQGIITILYNATISN